MAAVLSYAYDCIARLAFPRLAVTMGAARAVDLVADEFAALDRRAGKN